MLRSIGAVVAGYVIMSVLVMGGFGLLKLVNPGAFPTPDAFPETMVAIIIIGFGLVAATVGGYATAWIAKRKALIHGAALGVLAVVFGVFSALANPVSQPVWYLVSLMAAGFSGSILGASLRKRPL